MLTKVKVSTARCYPLKPCPTVTLRILMRCLFVLKSNAEGAGVLPFVVWWWPPAAGRFYVLCSFTIYVVSSTTSSFLTEPCFVLVQFIRTIPPLALDPHIRLRWQTYVQCSRYPHLTGPGPGGSCLYTKHPTLLIFVVMSCHLRCGATTIPRTYQRCTIDTVCIGTAVMLSGCTEVI